MKTESVTKSTRLIPVRPSHAEVWKEIERIRAGKNGVLTPGDVVDGARDSRSLLHPFFLWDDGIAAEKFRRLQASQLVYVVHARVTGPEQPSSRKAYIRVKLKGQSAFVTSVSLTEDGRLGHAVVAAAYRDLLSWHRRYRTVPGLKSIAQTLEEFLTERGFKTS